MSNNPFAAPASSQGITWADVEGRLLLIEPHGYESEIETVHGASDAVRADVAVLDGDNKGETFLDALIFPRALRSQLKPRLGDKVLGRLGKGQAQAGKSAPWLLTDPTEEDVQVGIRYLDYRAKNEIAKPEPAAPSPDTGSSVPF